MYCDPAKFHAGFCGDLSKEDAAFRTKPTFGIVATEDKSINPDIQRTMYKRSNTKVTEIKGSHAVYVSQPEKVAAVIVDAAQAVAAK